jgi:IS5 family transposase
MLLSEGQMSDHKGARIVLNALPKADCLIADKGYDSTWFREELLARASSRAPRPLKAGRNHMSTTKLSVVADTRSRTYSPNSRIGGASQRVMTDVPTPSSRQSASQLRSSSGCD